MNEPINIQLTLNEANLVLEALSNMAYYKVHELIYKIQSQAQPQVNKTANASVATANGAYSE
jgi:hypothetical protein